MGGFALLLLAVGLVLSLEGLVLALAPSRIDELLDLIRRMPVETRRNLGLGAMALGLALIWLATGLGG
ncbi:MAG: DUF2065 domain-containing protein [Rhodobacteraceae bacterium]|jgi:uncharacterized protein YjeT (DUF2065 family)|uniref:DUF2065 domain-containing protein n=1 Tax=Albidovulum sp. TaxID=1872424 RepID=UPI001D84D492|nr:DUF2065 domain-containing protein [uncultured Defluviimonas sp.]MCB2125856.1 DUF2065 domain-containing protein [Paracoccaceae bacterium]MCC0070058.1 DUF2065 domain-containing protein [Paracoccaceae bacterium]